MKSSCPQLSVIVPCYNEEEVLPSTIGRLQEVCAQQGYDAELLFVDDGSTDQTWPLIEAACDAASHVRGLKLSRNFGHEKALAAGLEACRGQRILILDADLQDPPELLPEMMALMDQGYQTVYGQRLFRQGESWLKKLTSALFYRFINMLTDIHVPKDTGDFRLISRAVLDAYLSMTEDKRFNRLMFAWVGFKSVALPYERAPRKAGLSKYNYRKLMNLAIDGITSFSIRPLKIALFLAFSSVVLAAVIMFWVLYAWWQGGSVSGWASTIITVLVIGASQLLTLGILGEYVGRLFIESKRRPVFIIEAERGVAPRGSVEGTATKQQAGH